MIQQNKKVKQMINTTLNIIADLKDLLQQQKTAVKLEKKIVFSDSDIALFNDIENDTLKQYIDILNQNDSNALIDFVKSNNIIIAKITDKDADWQSAIIQINDTYYINKNLDLSYGQQSENPRLKRSALLNTFLNYDLSSKKLKSLQPVYIQDLILSKQNNNIDFDIDFFNGKSISDVGFYDTRQPSKKAVDSSNDLPIVF